MHLTFMGAKVLNIIEYHKYFWIFFALWIVFRTFAEKLRREVVQVIVL